MRIESRTISLMDDECKRQNLIVGEREREQTAMSLYDTIMNVRNIEK